MTGWFSRLCTQLDVRWRWFWGWQPAANTPAGILGRLGEDTAAKFLRESGWKIIVRNWRHGRDELDIVAWDGAVLVFCEVRTRDARALVTGYHSVTERKKRALSRAVRAYLRGLTQPPAHFRFDIVEVKASDGVVAEVLHHAGIPLLSNNFQPARGFGRRP